ncbi:MAG: hypothetical protein IH790_01820 [Acidobacteria bacterium]|nr:hypothetical protein [Acidobacteriota bacterium]
MAKTREGKPFSRVQLEKDLKAIEDYLILQGYLRCYVSETVRYPDDENGVSLVVFIATREHTQIGFQGIDVEPGVGLVENRERRLEHRHLEDLVALLFAAGEPLVDRPVHETLVHPQQLHPLTGQGQEVDGVEHRLAAVLAHLVQRRLQ